MAYFRSTLTRRLPHGMTDLFLEQAAAKTALEETVQRTFRQWGYQRIIPPTLEYYDTLAVGASEEARQEMLRFFDREGNILALRPDMTVPTARVAGTKLCDQEPPLRFYYVGNVFSYVEPQAGRRREFTQAGIELIGAGTAEADAEVLAIAVAVLQAIGMPGFQINLGQVAYLQAIVGQDGLGEGELRRLEQAIERRNDVELQRTLAELGIAADAARAIRALPHLCGDEAVLREAERLASNASARRAIEHLERVYALLRAEGVTEHIIIDLGEVRRAMAYYTGITFHGFTAGLGFPICGGGRYDGLVGRFGADLPAVGFALGVERALLVTRPAVDLAPQVVMQSCGHRSCRAVAAQARARGLRVEMDVLGRSGQALLDYAWRRGAGRSIACAGGEEFLLAEGDATRRIARGELEEEIGRWNG